jgi:NAD(P)-dependent dehydrogenase (short-subunit alcohol dehydrogenase family)
MYASELIPKAAKRWSEKGVLTNIVRIGVANTEAFRAVGHESVLSRTALVPMKRIAEPDEIAKMIDWLISEDNTFTTGQVISVSGGE